MLAVPLGLTGVIAILFITNTTINIQSMIGTLMMIGVVVNNSILLVEFANQLRERGYSVHEAAVSAAKIRLRPILMTAGVLIASMLPFTVLPDSFPASIHFWLFHSIRPSTPIEYADDLNRASSASVPRARFTLVATTPKEPVP